MSNSAPVEYGTTEWLQSAYQKLARSLSHFRDLETASDAYLASNPFGLEITYDDEREFFVSRFRQHHEAPKSLSLILGDVLSNLRAALDHMTWAIACQSTAPAELWEDNRARQIGFPVARTKEQFPKLNVLKFLDQRSIDLLEQFQPYHRTDVGRAIERLDTFNNIDKHRLIHAAGGLIDFSDIHVRAGYAILDPEGNETESWRLGAPTFDQVHTFGDGIEDGTEIHHIRLENGPLRFPGEAHIEVTKQIKFKVFFGAGGNGVDLEFFKWMIGEIGAVEEHVSQLFAAR